jgi:hypothetical protein
LLGERKRWNAAERWPQGKIAAERWPQGKMAAGGVGHWRREMTSRKEGEDEPTHKVSEREMHWVRFECKIIIE